MPFLIPQDLDFFFFFLVLLSAGQAGLDCSVEDCQFIIRMDLDFQCRVLTVVHDDQ